MKYIALFVAALLAYQQGAVAGEGRSDCQSCLQGISRVHSQIAARAELDDFMPGRTCADLPSSQQAACNLVLRAGLPVLAAKLQTPIKACGELGLCNQTESVIAAAESSSNEINCELCEYAASIVKEQLEDPETESEILAKFTQVCSGLPGDAKTQCLQYIAEYGQELFNWIHEEKPEEMCILAGFCSETQPLQKLPPSLKPIVVHWLELQTPSQELHDEDQCNTCQLVILEAASVLSQPDTQKQLLEYIKQNCQNFEAFADQCAAYIDLYGPLVINMAKSYLKPTLCSQLGFCPKASDSISAS